MPYPSNIRTEFYRDTGIQVISSEMQIRPLTHMPGENFSGYRAILTTTGNFLIATGVKLKTLARPAAPLSQETQ